jgi:hypothetical protein
MRLIWFTKALGEKCLLGYFQTLEDEYSFPRLLADLW